VPRPIVLHYRLDLRSVTAIVYDNPHEVTIGLKKQLIRYALE